MPHPDMEMHARAVRARLDKGQKSLQNAEDLYRSAGAMLIEARERCKTEWSISFTAYFHTYVGISRTRVYQLIAIADGTKTLEGIQADNYAAKQRHIERQRQRDEENARSVHSGSDTSRPGRKPRERSAAKVSPETLARLRSLNPDDCRDLLVHLVTTHPQTAPAADEWMRKRANRGTTTTMRFVAEHVEMAA